MRASLHGGLGIACSGYDRLKFAWFGGDRRRINAGFWGEAFGNDSVYPLSDSARGVIHEEWEAIVQHSDQ